MVDQSANRDIFRAPKTILTEIIEHAGFRFALLTLANGDELPTTMTSASLAEFAAAVSAVDLSSVDAVAVTGMGSVFSVGADLRKFAEADTPEQAEDIARQGQDAFGLLSALPVPTFAFINGSALGGGLELALHAAYRTAADSVVAMGFPQTRLGLVPCWGGISRTVALIGPSMTAQVMVSDSLAGKHLTAGNAAELGLVDAVLPDSNFLAASLDFAAGILERGARRPVRETVSDYEVPLAHIRDQLDARLHGAAPAPYRALELISAAAADPSDEAGRKAQEAEIQAFSTLLLSDEARASIYATQLTQSLTKKPAGRPAVAPLPVRTVGVVGAGLMASQLAHIFAEKLRIPVRITDLSQDRVNAALDWIAGQLDRGVARGRLDTADAAAIRSLVTGGTDKAAFADCDVVIEAVFEELAVKQSVFAELEPLIRPDTLLLTNTSSLSIQAMGDALVIPGRLIGFHFFNPVAVLPLVEIIATPQTDQHTIATAFELASRLGKTSVLTSDTAGFVVNRVLTRVFSEVLSLLDEGADPITVDHAMDPLGLPMTPLQLLQFIGPAVQLHICEKMNRTYPERFSVSSSLQELVAAGLPGYLDDAGRISPAAAKLIPAPAPTDASIVRTRILIALAEEVTVMLNEGVVPGPEQIDLCMILGANYPSHTGGLTPLLDREVGTDFHPHLRVPVPASAELRVSS